VKAESAMPTSHPDAFPRSDDPDIIRADAPGPYSQWHVRASVMATFDPIEFRHKFGAGFNSPEFRSLIADSFQIDIPGLLSRWALKSDVRRAVLAGFQTADEVRATRAAAPAPDGSDPLRHTD
jgi:hypothetical protein